MPQPRDTRTVGARVETLLAELGATADPAVRDRAEELVRLLVELYGAGLEHIVAELRAAGEPGARVLDRLVADDLVASLLVLHDLHPADLQTRVTGALDEVRPYLGSHAGGVELLEVGADGVVRLRLEGTCNGCPSSTLTVRTAIERAITRAAPEVVRVEVDGVVAEPMPEPVAGSAGDPAVAPTAAGGLPLLQILPGPPPDAPGLPRAAPTGPETLVDGWVVLGPPPAVPVGALTSRRAGGAPLVLCRLDGGWYAYGADCPDCGSGLAAATLAGDVLTCVCGGRYDVRLAGRSLAGGRGLRPIPLLLEAGELRVAPAPLAVGVRA